MNSPGAGPRQAHPRGEGRDHLARRRVMLPPFHGERMRAYEATVREVFARDVEAWPEGEPFPLHPRMQRATLEVILLAVFGVTDEERRERLADRLGGLLADTASAGLQFRVLLARRWSPATIPIPTSTRRRRPSASPACCCGRCAAR